jgi:hypothetical protein
MGVQPKPSDGIKPKRGVDRIESNRNQKLNGIKPKTETEWKPSAEMSQTDIRNRMESNRNQELKGINPNTEIEWNQSKTNY